MRNKSLISLKFFKGPALFNSTCRDVIITVAKAQQVPYNPSRIVTDKTAQLAATLRNSSAL